MQTKWKKMLETLKCMRIAGYWDQEVFKAANSLFDEILSLFNVISFESVLFIELRPYSD